MEESRVTSFWSDPGSVAAGCEFPNAGWRGGGELSEGNGRTAIEMARNYSLPVISGGDRHACEPAACLNLTRAGTFGEFVSEVKAGYSQVLFMPQYREPLAVRILETEWQIVRPYPEFAGRERWTDRVFYRGDDGQARPLSTIWREHMPWIVRPAAAMLQFCGVPGVRPALRRLFSQRAEMLP